ncbi:nicotinate-nucleotide adenylyltransferase [Altererythrobacter aurantiacus]|uniref:Probable nicotinate-nucleotide adenylyltransferase n=1 Tax=Parapontixanthobacter aurantiacus TaxID=1463599 RepID=A0A844ZGY3_9SPHN|nr:nicotinate-nucleotide adenylyltransferase [Parapontixanthobacter aurantiacus]MXO86804.1 nicotinate-nucleotide adenylyltransferase [Parapontixanthobacter aurantiacus]
MAGSRQRPDAFLKRSRTNRIGLLGGSFNPAHGGHRRISLFAMKALMLGEVWWLVSPGNPLKPREGMADLASRLTSAKAQARRAPIRPTAIERDLGTRYTVDTLRALKRRYPKRNFVWLMGSDNLAQFHRWRQWRVIARTMPIAVIARPGYNLAAMRSPAMLWLRRFRVSRDADLASLAPPALLILRFDPDERSATKLRAANPDWENDFANRPVRDTLTHKLVAPDKLS